MGGVFPAGATLSVKKLSGSEEKSVSAAVEDAKENGRDAKGNSGDAEKTAASYTFDIKVLDKDGNELEPDEKKGSVSVSFALDEAANQNLAAGVWHITGETGGLNAEALNAKTDGGTVTAETDGFSYYQVEFTYGGKQYVLPGDESVALTEILSDVGITNADGSAAKDDDITAAEGSDDALFTVEKTDGVWMATAITAFHTDEWLRVTVDGVEYEVVVTDAEYSSSVSISNLKQGDVLKPGTTISGNMQLAFKDNRHSLTESGPIVDDNIGTQVYNSLKIVSGGAALCGSYTYYPIDEDGNHVDKWVIIHVFTYTTGQPPYFMLGGYSSIAKYSETTSFTYDGKNKSPITDDRNVTIAGTYSEKTAGSYTATVTPKSGCTWSDGTTGTKTVNWSILPQSLTIPTLSNTAFTYKRQTTYKPTVNDYDSKTMTQAPTNLSQYEVGEYTVKWTLKDPTNYQWSDGTTGEKSAIWSIVKADISPTVAMSGWTYGETASEPALRGDLGYAPSVTVTYQYKVKDADDSTYTTIKPSNAGNYTVRATIEERDYYNGGTATADFTISPKSLSIPTLTNTTITYNGSEQSPTVNNYDNSTMNQSGTTSATNVGNYTVTWTLKNTTNYKWSDNTTADKSSSWSIGKASINPTVTLAGWTYCDTAKTPSVTGNPGNGAVTYEYKEQGEADTKYRKEQPSNAGNYTVRATIAETANYNGGKAEADFTIERMEVKVSGITANDKTYDGTTTATLITNGAGLKFDGKKNNDVLSITATGTFSDKNAGSGKTVNITNLSLGGASESNYKLASSGNQTTTTATIKQRSITLKSDSATKEYDEKPLTKDHVTISGADFLSGEGVTCTVTGSQTEVGSSKNSFTYTLDAGTLASNYNIKTTFGTLTVEKRKNTWTTFPSITNWTYGADPDTVVNKGATLYGSTDTITVRYWGKDDTVYAKSETPPTVVGTYNIFFEQPETETDGGASYQTTFTITPKEVGLSWSDLTFTYDGDSHKPVAEATDLVEGDTCTVAVKGEKTDQGTYKATASSLSNTNYKLPSANTTEFTIEPCATTIDIAVSDMIYTGEALKPVPTVWAVANNNKKIAASEYTVTYEDNTDVGTATVTVADKDGGNYIITGNSETFTVIKKSIANDNTEAADNKAGLAEVLIKDFPDATYSGVEHKPEADISYNGHTLRQDEDYTISYKDNVAKGTATVTITGKGSYKGTVEKTFTIHESRVTITAENKSGVYGSDLDELSYQLSGTDGDDFVYEDDLEGLAIRLHTDAKKTSPAGAYPIDVTYTANDNYEMTVVPGTYTITKKDITIKADAKTKVYGTANPKLTYTKEGILPGDSPLSGSLSVDADEDTGVGDYDIVQGTVEADDNYHIAEYVGAKLTVTKAAQARPVYGKDFTYQKETGSDKATFVACVDGLGLYESNDDSLPVAVANNKAQIDVGKTYYVRREEQTNFKPSGYTAFTAERAPKVTVKVEAAPKGCGTAAVKKSGAAGSGSGSLSVEMGTEITVIAQRWISVYGLVGCGQNDDSKCRGGIYL